MNNCCSCGAEKNLLIHSRYVRKDGVEAKQYYCRTCWAAMKSKYYHKNPESQKEANERYRKSDKGREVVNRLSRTRKRREKAQAHV